MTLRYRTTGAWGTGLGANLTPAQVDENFYTLQQAVDAVTSGTDGVSVTNVTLVGSQLTFYLSDGSTLGPYTITTPTVPPLQTITGSAVTLSSTHLSKYNRCTNTGGCTITVGPDDGLAVGTESHWRQGPDCPALSFIEGDTGVVINGVVGYSLGTDTEGAVVTLKKVGTNEYDLFGHLATGTF
jgi:hypothetical protein